METTTPTTAAPTTASAVPLPLGAPGEDMAMVDATAAAVRGFGLGPALGLEAVTEGLMNRNWRVDTPEGTWALKQVLDVDAAQARRQHQVTLALAGMGLPVPAPRTTPDGDTLVEVPDVGVFALLPWVPGRVRSGAQLSPEACRQLGATLARVHHGLAELAATEVLEPPPAAVTVPVAAPETADTKIDRYLEHLTRRPHPDGFDALVARRLTERRALLEQLGHLRPTPATVAPVGWVHGDFHDLNLLWSGAQPDRVVAVLDWDRLRIQPLAAEVVRTATLVFGYEESPADGGRWALDLGRIAAFVGGYQDTRASQTGSPLPAGQLADAIHRLWWARVCDFWQLAWHYDRADASCDHLFVSASALLAWWSAHRGQVTAAVTLTSR